jgi:hypothetical protein
MIKANLPVLFAGVVLFLETGTAVTFFLTRDTDLFFGVAVLAWRVLTFPSGRLLLGEIDFELLLGLDLLSSLVLGFPVCRGKDAEGNGDASLKVQVDDFCWRERIFSTTFRVDYTTGWQEVPLALVSGNKSRRVKRGEEDRGLMGASVVSSSVSFCSGRCFLWVCDVVGVYWRRRKRRGGEADAGCVLRVGGQGAFDFSVARGRWGWVYQSFVLFVRGSPLVCLLSVRNGIAWRLVSWGSAIPSQSPWLPMSLCVYFCVVVFTSTPLSNVQHGLCWVSPALRRANRARSWGRYAGSRMSR